METLVLEAIGRGLMTGFMLSVHGERSLSWKSGSLSSVVLIVFPVWNEAPGFTKVQCSWAGVPSGLLGCVGAGPLLSAVVKRLPAPCPLPPSLSLAPGLLAAPGTPRAGSAAHAPPPGGFLRCGITSGTPAAEVLGPCLSGQTCGRSLSAEAGLLPRPVCSLPAFLFSPGMSENLGNFPFVFAYL